MKVKFKSKVTIMHASMLSPMGGPRAYVGHLTSIAFPILGNLTKNLVPRVGTFAFLARRNGTKSHRPICSSVRRRLFPFRKQAMPFLTVDAIIGSQAFQNGRCYICSSQGLEKVKIDFNLLMELKCTHQMLNFSYSLWFACG